MVEYIKGFLTLFLLIKVLLYFVPKNGFAKYISFFAGVVLVIGMMYPILQLSGQEEVVIQKFQVEGWEAELVKISNEAKQLEEAGLEELENEYDKYRVDDFMEDHDKNSADVMAEEATENDTNITTGKETAEEKNQMIEKIHVETINISGNQDR